MLIAFRVDASLKMGTGHTYRMLTLAHKLKSRGHTVFFICRKLQGNLIDFIRESFEVLALPEPTSNQITSEHCSHAAWLEVAYELEIEQSFSAISYYLKAANSPSLDWLIIDHYAIEQKFQLAMQPLVKKCMQVDDLADRNHHVDILLDQNYYLQGAERYNGLLPSQSQRLCGPAFALLRDEFYLTRNKLEAYEERLARRDVVLFFGGVDIANETTKALTGLLSVSSRDHFHVIIGSNNPHRDSISELCEKHSSRVSLHIQVANIKDFFATAYLYVGAVGATTWERCIMALPGIVCSVAKNQIQVAEDLQVINAHEYLGQNTTLNEADYAKAYLDFISNPDWLSEQSKRCADLVSGNGCEKVVRQLEEIASYDEL